MVSTEVNSRYRMDGRENKTNQTTCKERQPDCHATKRASKSQVKHNPCESSHNHDPFQTDINDTSMFGVGSSDTSENEGSSIDQHIRYKNR